METFDDLFKTVTERFIHKHGQSKYNKIEDVVRNSKKLADLAQRSIQARSAPSGGDFSATLQSIGYFMFASNATCLMGDLMAINDWDKKVNSRFSLSSQADLLHRAKSRLSKWGPI